MELINIEGISNGIVPNYLRCGFYNGDDSVNIVLGVNSNDIYYFVPSSSSTFPVSTPDMLLLNDEWVYHTAFSSGELSGTNVAEVYNANTGNVLKDQEKSVLISTSDIYIPTTTTTTTPTTTTTTTLIPTTTTTTTESFFTCSNWTAEFLGGDCSMIGNILNFNIYGLYDYEVYNRTLYVHIYAYTPWIPPDYMGRIAVYIYNDPGFSSEVARITNYYMGPYDWEIIPLYALQRYPQKIPVIGSIEILRWCLKWPTYSMHSYLKYTCNT